MAQTEVTDQAALADVEEVEVRQGLTDLGHSLVRDPALDQGQAPEVEEAAGDVVHGGVCDATEGEVEALEADAALGEVTHSDVTDVVTTPEVQRPQGTDLRERLHAGVRDVGAEGEVERGEGAEALGDVAEAVVTHPLAVLEVELLQRRPGGGRGQGHHSGIRHLPAGPQLEAPESPEAGRDGAEAGIGDQGAAAELEVLEAGAVRGQVELHRLVRHLLAETEVERGEARQILSRDGQLSHGHALS